MYYVSIEKDDFLFFLLFCLICFDDRILFYVLTSHYIQINIDKILLEHSKL